MKNLIPSFRFVLLLLILLSINNCRKEEAEILLFTPAGTITDVDNNTYQTIRIGNQVWMAENLKTTRFRDSSLITDATRITSLASLSSGVYYNYNDDELANTYGLLYNYYAIENINDVAPEGWHIPTSDEWDTLINYIGGLEGSAIKLKNKTGWTSGGNGTNISGFSALPGGMALFTYSVTVDYIEDFGCWWCADVDTNFNACAVKISFHRDDISKSCNYSKNLGLSIRCVKD